MYAGDMVLKKSLECGFNGCCIPVIPKGPRSVRKTGAHKKAIEDSRIYAFELLAAVAGKLLRESESSTSVGVQDPSAINRDGIKQEQLNKGETLGSECLDQGSRVESVFGSEIVPQKCNISNKIYHDLKLEIRENKTTVENSRDKVEGGSLNCGDIDEVKHDNNVDLTVPNYSNLKDPMEINMNSTVPLINSDSSVQLPSYKDSVPNASFPRHRNKLKFSTVDDENFGGCNENSSNLRSFRSQTHIGHRRMRKLLTSKYWKVAPKLEDCEFSNTDGYVKPVSCSRKAPYTRKRIQCQGPLKKRKLCDCSSTLACDPEECHQTSFQSRDSYVKFSIKSFKVPELYIDVPENTTVGCLKKTVMEAVTAILQGGLHVGVVVHGKKVKDDNKTLLQTGISPKDNLDTLGFTLESDSTIASPSRTPKELPTLLPCKTQHQLIEGTSTDSRALVAIPAVSGETFAMVPANQKTRHSELVQRRTRRPFSVSEVEALVEAVEKLGTGRWRDVKLSFFENADHRTYVDLKDKWKTLVHTATISPQQRRGEPVPQDLLDRVLSAHGYWSHHQQPKLHGLFEKEV